MSSLSILLVIHPFWVLNDGCPRYPFLVIPLVIPSLSLLDTKQEKGIQVVEEIRVAIENMKVELAGVAVKRTITVGVD